jgi:hypothetical protein
MKIMERLRGTAKNSKKKMIIVGAVVFIVCAGAFLYFSGAGAKFFKPSASNPSEKGDNQQQAATNIKRPDRNPDLMGLVESVSGNEVKILLLDASAMPQTGRNGGNSTGNNGGNRGQQAGAANSGQDNAGVQQGQTGGSQRGQWQGGQGGQAGNSEAAKAARAAMLTELKKKSTGEATIIVPVGIQMTKMGGFQPGAGNGGPRNGAGNGNNNGGNAVNANAGGNNGNNGNRPAGAGEVAASFTDLTTDKMVMIWLNPKVTDRKIAEFVSITR